MPSPNASDAGYTLVELAVALVVIGLLIGGTLKGIELIDSARLKSVLSQVNEYRVATTLFLDRYDALPGDYHLASQTVHKDLKNGPNSGILTGDGLAHNSPSLHFWTHLAAAGFISKPGTIPSGQPARFGQGAPAAKIGGGFTIANNPNKDMIGLWFVLGEENGSKNNKAGLTPLQAMNLDAKADNGDPTSGKIRALEGASLKANSCVTKDNKYNTENTEKACVLYFKL